MECIDFILFFFSFSFDLQRILETVTDGFLLYTYAAFHFASLLSSMSYIPAL